MPLRLFVAVVDDDIHVCKALCRLLRTAGLRAEGHDSAGTFLAQLDQRVPDCLVIDVHMPEMSGPALEVEIRRCGHTFPVIFMTAHQDFASVGAGLATVLQKPFSEEALLNAIAAATHIMDGPIQITIAGAGDPPEKNSPAVMAPHPS